MNADRQDELDESEPEHEFVCPICPQAYKYASTVRLHLLSHGGSVKCRDCQTTVKLSALKQHLRRNHQIFNNFPTWYIEKIEELQNRFPVLRTQISSVKPVKKVKCEKCNMKFRYSLTLDNHHCCPVTTQTRRRSIANMESSKENNNLTLIKCRHCSVKVEPDQLSFHMKNFHSAVTECVVCKSEFNSLAEYKNHLSKGKCPQATQKLDEENEVQKINADSSSADSDLESQSYDDPNESKADDGKYEFCCPLCEFVSHQHGLVRRHIVYFHGSIQCSKCDGSFKLPFLKRHLKYVHGKTGNTLPKSYYKVKAEMEDHFPKISKRLIGELLHCEKCQKSFTDQKLLNDHACKMLRSSSRTSRASNLSTPLYNFSSDDNDEPNEPVVSSRRKSVKRKLTKETPTNVLCKFCSNLFSFRALRKHIKDSHPYFKMAFTCNTCKRNFRKVTAYENHHRFCVPANDKSNQEIEVTAISDESMTVEVKEEEEFQNDIDTHIDGQNDYTPQLKKSRLTPTETENKQNFSEPQQSDDVESKVGAMENKAATGKQKSLLPSPKQIFNFLARFVIGRDECKKALSVAAFNHYLKHGQNSNQLVSKENILLIGPSSSSKSSLVTALATCLQVPFVHIDCQLLRGNEILGQEMLSNLVKIADGNMDQAAKAIVFLDKFDLIEKDVQHSLYKLLTTAQVAFGDSIIETRSILFICSGQFSSLDLATDNSSSLSNRQVKNSELTNLGLIPELVALFPVKIVFQGLTVDSIVNTLQNSLVEEFSSLFRCYDNCILEITLGALQSIAENIIRDNIAQDDWKSIFEQLLQDAMFEVPGSDITKVIVHVGCVLRKEPVKFIKL